jgi:hypothetical protein
MDAAIDSLLQGIGDKGQDFLFLIQQQAGREVSQPFVGKSGRRKKLDTLDLTKVCPLPQCEEVE